MVKYVMDSRWYKKEDQQALEKENLPISFNFKIGEFIRADSGKIYKIVNRMLESTGHTVYCLWENHETKGENYWGFAQ